MSSSQKREICEIVLMCPLEEKFHNLYFSGGNIYKCSKYSFDDQIDTLPIIEFFEHLDFKQKTLKNLEIFLNEWCLELI